VSAARKAETPELGDRTARAAARHLSPLLQGYFVMFSVLASFLVMLLDIWSADMVM
jgi:hypothetical protein